MHELTLSSFKPVDPVNLLMFSGSREEAMEGLTAGRLSLNSVNKILQSLGSILPLENNGDNIILPNILELPIDSIPGTASLSSYLEFSFLQGPWVIKTNIFKQ